jgi:hypothetical protein
VQPGFDVRAGREAVKCDARPGDCLLGEILGILAVLGELQRGPDELRTVRQRLALESLG